MFINGGTENARITAGGNLGIGTLGPTASVHIRAGTGTASTAPLKLTAGTNLTTPENGAIEYSGRLSFTESDGVRRSVVQAIVSTKTTAAAPYVNDGFITLRIDGVDVKVMTTA